MTTPKRGRNLSTRSGSLFWCLIVCLALLNSCTTRQSAKVLEQRQDSLDLVNYVLSQLIQRAPPLTLTSNKLAEPEPTISISSSLQFSISKRQFLTLMYEQKKWQYYVLFRDGAAIGFRMEGRGYYGYDIWDVEAVTDFGLAPMNFPGGEMRQTKRFEYGGERGFVRWTSEVVQWSERQDYLEVCHDIELVDWAAMQISKRCLYDPPLEFTFENGVSFLVYIGLKGERRTIYKGLLSGKEGGVLIEFSSGAWPRLQAILASLKLLDRDDEYYDDFTIDAAYERYRSIQYILGTQQENRVMNSDEWGEMTVNALRVTVFGEPQREDFNISVKAFDALYPNHQTAFEEATWIPLVKKLVKCEKQLERGRRPKAAQTGTRWQSGGQTEPGSGP